MASVPASRSDKAPGAGPYTWQKSCRQHRWKMPTNPRLDPRESHFLTQGLGATERRGNVFVHYDPAFSALLQYHGPARIEVRAGAFFADELDSQGEGCPSEGSAAVLLRGRRKARSNREYRERSQPVKRVKSLCECSFLYLAIYGAAETPHSKSCFGAVFGDGGGEEPSLQHAEKLRPDVAEGDANAEIRLRVDNGSRGFKELSL